MPIRVLLICFILSFGSIIHAQDYYVPYEFQQAVKKGTRTNEGIPGANYFQNSSNYHIRVRIDARRGILYGREEVVYHNFSPDTLQSIVLRMYQNIFKKGALRDAEEDPANINDGMIITAIKIGNTDIYARYKTDATNMTIFLKKGLSPNDSLRLSLNWNFKLPTTPVHRFGKYGDATWFIGYWYPQIAVYDDIEGWDMMNYNGTHRHAE